jgi:hypothetical protein
LRRHRHRRSRSSWKVISPQPPNPGVKLAHDLFDDIFIFLEN